MSILWLFFIAIESYWTYHFWCGGRLFNVKSFIYPFHKRISALCTLHWSNKLTSKVINYISPFIISITLQERCYREVDAVESPTRSAINSKLKQIDGHRSLFILGDRAWKLKSSRRRTRRKRENWNVNMKLHLPLFIHLRMAQTVLTIFIDLVSRFALIFLHAVIHCSDDWASRSSRIVS